MNETQYVSVNPAVLRGKPCIAGTRISVELILELLSLGYSVNDILDDYPQLIEKQSSLRSILLVNVFPIATSEV